MSRISNSIRSTSHTAIAAALCAAGLAFAALPNMAMAQASNAQHSEASTTSATGIQAWGIDSDDISADSEVVFGVLPNGMRYAIKNNGQPAGEATIHLTMDVGNREEEDAERGAAHFVEHMGFNGTTNIPEGELIPKLERLGLQFGPDTGATTDIDNTEYMLNLPNVEADTIDTSLFIMREFASNMTLAPDAVERERGIILNEAQTRNDPGRRRVADYMQAAAPESRIGMRINADRERINNISTDELRAFYEGYYRPERATLVVVGDVEPKEMQQKIQSAFGDWQGTGKPRTTYITKVSDRDEPTLANFVDPAVPEFIEVNRISEWKPDENSIASSLDSALQEFAKFAVILRIVKISQETDTPTLGPVPSEGDLFRAIKPFGLTLVAKDGKWEETLALAEQELRRAEQHGFTQSEIDEIKAIFKTSLENGVTQSQARKNDALATELIAASLKDTIFTSPAFNLDLYRETESSITPAAVTEAFRTAWKGGPTVVHVSTKAPIENAQAKIAAVLKDSATLAVSAPEEAQAVEFAYGEWGTPSAITSDTVIEDLGIRSIRFANGLQLNMKQTDFAPGKVSYSLRIGDGLSGVSEAKAGVQTMLPIVSSLDGLGKHDADELRRALSGKQLDPSISTRRSGLVSSGAIAKDDLDLQLDILTARLTDTAWRPETQAQWEGYAPIIAANQLADPTQIFINNIHYTMAGNDPRFGLGDAAALSDISLEDLKSYIQPQLENGSLTIGLVGDFDPDAAIQAVSTSLATLPKRADRVEKSNATTRSSPIAEDGVKTLYHQGNDDQAVIALSWPTDDDSDLRDTLSRQILASAMHLRLLKKLREESGTTYSPGAFSVTQSTYPGFGHITAYTTSTPDNVDGIAAGMRAIAKEFADEEVDQDLLARARNPILEQYERGETDNANWVSLVAMAQSQPSLLDRRRQREDILRSITPADIRAAAQKYLTGNKPVEFRVLPKAGANK